MKQIRIENGMILYYGNKAGRVSNGRAVVDTMVPRDGTGCLFRQAENSPGSPVEGRVFDRLMSRSVSVDEAQALKNCRVWQLSPMWTSERNSSDMTSSSMTSVPLTGRITRRSLMGRWRRMI